MVRHFGDEIIMRFRHDTEFILILKSFYAQRSGTYSWR